MDIDTDTTDLKRDMDMYMDTDMGMDTGMDMGTITRCGHRQGKN
jgi:hypothetical protein